MKLAADVHLARAYLETYYGNLYDFHKTVGLSVPPNAVDAKRVESVLQTAWVGKNYSSRIWSNQAKLARELEATMLQAIHRGSSIQQLSKALSRRMDVAYSNAERLIRTELNAVENRASAEAMKSAEFTHYQFMATLDRRTCARCGERDGEVYRLSEMNQGENAPPLHARCRCTIVAYDGLQYGTRAARDFGDSVKGKSVSLDADESGDKKIKTPFGEVNGTKVKITLSNGEVVDHYRRVPADMTYRDWKAIYIDKTKTLETWRAEFDAQRQADEQSPLRQRGRQVIDDLSAGRLPTAASGGKVGTDGFKFDLQRFGVRRIPEGEYNLTIRRQVQNRHIEGTHEYREYVERRAETTFKPSKMSPNINIQALVNEFHGKGIYDPNPKDNSTRETVDTGKVIGQYWNNRTHEFVDTTWIMIVYSKKGTHVYPIRPEGV